MSTSSRLGFNQSRLGNFTLGQAGGATLDSPATSTLALSQVGLGQSVFNRSANSTFNPSQEALSQRLIIRSLPDALTLTDIALATMSYNRRVQSNLVLLNEALFGGSYVHPTSDVLELNQEIELETTIHHKYTNVFNDWPIHHETRIVKIISVAETGFHEPGHLCKIGESIKFMNHSKVTHTISGPFDTFTLVPGTFKEVVLLKAGVFEFASDKLPKKGQLNIQS